jgi:hypothetical protein
MPTRSLSDGAHRRALWGGLRLPGSRFRSQVSSQREKPALARRCRRPRQDTAARDGKEEFGRRALPWRAPVCIGESPDSRPRPRRTSGSVSKEENMWSRGQYVRSRFRCHHPRTLRSAQRENYVEAYPSYLCTPGPIQRLRAPLICGEGSFSLGTLFLSGRCTCPASHQPALSSARRTSPRRPRVAPARTGRNRSASR